MMDHWWLIPQPEGPLDEFASLAEVFRLKGEGVASDPLSEVIRVERNGVYYYVKRYWGGGKGLRRFVGRPRVKAEWQNLRLFERWGIPTAPIVAWGLERKASGVFARGALITRGLDGTEDLAKLAGGDDPRLRDRAWVYETSRQLAAITRRLHGHHFAHNDLKWRNLLVDQAGKLYLIDCPTGTFWWGPFLKHRIVKDLACLDKLAKRKLSSTQRLRFYLQYCEKSSLDGSDKARIRQILAYFEGRE